ncbi:MAG: glycosyltransferase [Candidatus Heimdallarchaeota archaeon]|nr:glycosyltransferase [Candidatus Heimdallarchaeota archaeon]MBY8993676.1 glycosyltransferase [Candidatus Heimdallarchaeota archaeon]
MSKSYKPKGVILVSFEYPPRRLTKASDVIFKLAQYLTKQKVRTHVITFDDWRTSTEVESKVVVTRIPNPIPNNISPFSTAMNLKAAYQSAIASVLNKEQIDVIHFFDWQTLPLLIPWDLCLNVVKIYSTSSLQLTRNATSSPHNDGIKKVEQLSLQTLDLILADSIDIMKILHSDYKIDEKKVLLQPLIDINYSKNVFSLYQNLIEKAILEIEEKKGA